MLGIVMLVAACIPALIAVTDVQAAGPGKIVYAGKFPTGPAGIGTTDAQGNGYARIIDAPADTTLKSPVWSLDGGSLAYLQVVDADQTATLHVANADGSNTQQLEITGHYLTDGSPKPIWSVDNSKVLVAATPIGQPFTENSWTWLWVNADGSGQQVLTSSTTGRPYGTTSDRVYYLASGSGQQVCSITIQNPTTSCGGSAPVSKQASLSSDGSRTASLAAGNNTQTVQVTTESPATTTTINLPTLPGLTNIGEVAWMPQTTNIAFMASVNGGENNWYTINTVNPGQVNKLNIDAEGIDWWSDTAPQLNYGAYTPLTPARITDTRPGSGKPNAGQTLAPQGVLNVQATGQGGVPVTGVSAVVVNVTAVNPTLNTFLTAYPTGAVRPNASVLNISSGQIANNQTTVGVGTGGKISIYNNAGNTNVVVDVVGYYGDTGGSFHPITPLRIMDTRPFNTIPANGNTTVNVTEPYGFPDIPANVTSIVVNVTQVNATANGFLTVYPVGTPRPDTSSMNYMANKTLTKEVNTKVGNNASHSIIVANSGLSSADIVVDVVGYFTPDMTGRAYAPISPARIADTRPNSGYPFAGVTFGPNTFMQVRAKGVVPSNARGLVNNLTMPSSTVSSSYLTAYPVNTSTPTGTAVTYTGSIAFNQSTVALTGGPDEGFKLYNRFGVSQAVVDVLGYYY